MENLRHELPKPQKNNFTDFETLERDQRLNFSDFIDKELESLGNDYNERINVLKYFIKLFTLKYPENEYYAKQIKYLNILLSENEKLQKAPIKTSEPDDTPPPQFELFDDFHRGKYKRIKRGYQGYFLDAMLQVLQDEPHNKTTTQIIEILKRHTDLNERYLNSESYRQETNRNDTDKLTVCINWIKLHLDKFLSE